MVPAHQDGHLHILHCHAQHLGSSGLHPKLSSCCTPSRHPWLQHPHHIGECHSHRGPNQGMRHQTEMGSRCWGSNKHLNLQCQDNTRLHHYPLETEDHTAPNREEEEAVTDSTFLRLHMMEDQPHQSSNSASSSYES